MADTEQKIILNVSDRFVSETDDGKRRIIEAEEKFKAAAKFLDDATAQIKDSWIEWLRESKTYMDEIRTWRMAMEKEKNLAMAATRDTIEFLGGKEVSEKLIVLRELVDVSERLKALKDSGHLDSMVECLIKIKP